MDRAWGTGLEGRRIADLGDGTYRNPVLAGDFPDPTVLKDGADYYLTTSSFDASPGLLIHHSRDLVNWAPLTFALPRPLTTVFAVDLVKHGGRYFIYIPFIPSPWAPEFGSAPRIFVISADRIEGPWSEPVDLGITGAIDPGHVVGEDGKRYLFLNGVRRVRLTDDGLATDGPVEHVYDGWRYPDDWVIEAYALEGPKLFRRGDWFYLVSAVGGTAGPPTSHMVTVARSRSVHGPWEDDPANPVVRTAQRGRGVVVARPRDRGRRTGRRLVAGVPRLRERLPDARPAGAARAGRVDRGRLDAGDGRRPVRPDPQAVASRPGRDRRMPLSDRARPAALGPQWTFYAPGPRRGGPASGSRAARCAWPGREPSPSDASPLTVPAGDRAYEVEVTVSGVEPGAHGGLLLFFNRALYLGMGWDGDDDDYVQRGPPQPLPGAGHAFGRAASAYQERPAHRDVLPQRRRHGLDPARRAVRDERLQRQHGERLAQPAPGALRRRARRRDLQRLPLSRRGLSPHPAVTDAAWGWPMDSPLPGSKNCR